ncbi:MAG: 2-C-methyl-D-erythritol 4-phosphate cytidylyltransferase, partial [Acidimicrobiia bacterium]
RYAGPSALVHAPTLIKRVSDLPSSVRTVVFFDEPVPDAATVATIDAMLAEFAKADTDVLAVGVTATEAVKRVDANGTVLEGIDRGALVSIRCPEVIDRRALVDAVRDLTDELWVNPTRVVAARGGRVRLYDRPMVPSKS